MSGEETAAAMEGTGKQQRRYTVGAGYFGGQEGVAAAARWSAKLRPRDVAVENMVAGVAERVRHLVVMGERALAEEPVDGPNGVPAPLPTHEAVAKFVEFVNNTAQCCAGTPLVGLVYLERFLRLSQLRLSAKNWRSLVSVSMLLASKVWDDLSMSNADFATIVDVSLAQMNRWERLFVAGLKYDVSVSAAQYAACFFDVCRVPVAGDGEAEDGVPAAKRPQVVSVGNHPYSYNAEDAANAENQNRVMSVGVATAGTVISIPPNTLTTCAQVVKSMLRRASSASLVF